MALSVPGIAIPPMLKQNGWAFVTLDASGEMVGAVLQMPKNGTITDIGFRTSVVTIADDLAIGLYAVDPATGFPDVAAPYKGMVAGTVTPVAITSHTVTLVTPATNVVRGDVVAVVISIPTYVGANLTIGTCVTTGDVAGLPYSVVYAAGAWAKTTVSPILWMKYSDGSYAYIPGVLPGHTATLTYKQDTIIADEYGLVFTAPANCSVAGWWAYLALGAICDVVLYRGTTELAICSIDNDVTQATGGAVMMQGMFPSPVLLTSGQRYRITLRPASTAATSILYHVLTPSVDAMNALPLGSSAFLCRRLDLGAWDDTLSTRRPMIGVVT